MFSCVSLLAVMSIVVDVAVVLAVAIRERASTKRDFFCNENFGDVTVRVRNTTHLLLCHVCAVTTIGTLTKKLSQLQR